MKNKLPKRLRELREHAGINQRQLAQLAGLDPAYYWRIEEGKVKAPAWETICAIADALKIPIESFR